MNYFKVHFIDKIKALVYILLDGIHGYLTFLQYFKFLIRISLYTMGEGYQMKCIVMACIIQRIKSDIKKEKPLLKSLLCCKFHIGTGKP